MEELEKWKNWLMAYPGWEGALGVDDTGPGMGCGLFPMGVKVLHRQTDVAGNCYVRLRSTCRLRRVCPVSEGAAWLMDLSRWVQQQSETGNIPHLGDVAATETVTAENGRMEKRDPGGTATYCMDLVVAYTSVYPAG